MRLLDYPGLLGKWPPPACNAAGTVAFNHCSDVATGCVAGPAGPRHFRATISTVFDGKTYVRLLSLDNEIFARVFRDFINKNTGKTIAEIGEIDVTHFG